MVWTSFAGGMQRRRKVSKSGAVEVEALKAGLPSVKLFELDVRTPGGLLLGVRYARGSIFGAFLRQVFPFSA